MTIPPAGGQDHGTAGAHARAPGTPQVPRQNVLAGHGRTDALSPVGGAGTRDPDDSAVAVPDGAKGHKVPGGPEPSLPFRIRFVYDLLSNKYRMLDGLCRLIWQVTLAVVVILVAMAGLAYIAQHAAPADEKIAVGAATTVLITVFSLVRRYWRQKRQRKRKRNGLPRDGVSEGPRDDSSAADGSGD